MPRNLFERCEVAFPVRDSAALARIHDEILPAYLADTVKARLQQPDGNYLRASKVLKDAPSFSSQEFLMKLAEGKVDLSAIPPAGVAKSHPPSKLHVTTEPDAPAKPSVKAARKRAHAAD
jgi:polyphosphate kinase